MSQGTRMHHRTGLATAVIAGAQLMIVLDLTIVNVALPTIQRALHFTPTNLAWIVNAYTLVFGGLLLLGGRSGDLFGRRRMFMLGVGLFAAASALSGLAHSQAWLISGRALQGIGAAIASPTALALISATFTEPRERGRAFAIYSAVSAGGAAIGLLAGGLLTQYASWPWVFYVNVPIAALLILLAPRVLAETPRHPGSVDVPGALSGTAGLAAVVYGLIHASTTSWTNHLTLASLGAGIVLLLAFVIIEALRREPLIDISVLRHRQRGGAVATILFVAASMFSVFFFITQFMQDVMGYSPVRTGLAFLPMSLGIMVVAQIVSRSIHRIGPKPFMVGGITLIGVSMAWLSQLQTSWGYGQLVGPLLVLAVGAGSSFVSLFPTATQGVEPKRVGMASALVTVGQQVGGTLGLSTLVSVAAAAARRHARALVPQVVHHRISPAALTLLAEVHGWARAFDVAVILAAAGLAIGLFVVRHSRPRTEVGKEGEAAAVAL